VSPADLRARHEADIARAGQEEQQLNLMLEVIDAGRKTIAKRLHPDAGGNHEQMQQLNAAHKRLKSSL
jgi:hypothetical protein